MNREEFYIMLNSGPPMSTVLCNILMGPDSKDCGFYELCSAFAAGISICESEPERLTQELKMQVEVFCQKHALALDCELFRLITWGYTTLLQPTINSIPKVREHWSEGGYAFDFSYTAALPSEIMIAVFGDAMYE